MRAVPNFVVERKTHSLVPESSSSDLLGNLGEGIRCGAETLDYKLVLEKEKFAGDVK